MPKKSRKPIRRVNKASPGNGFKYPFGEESCEHELAVLKEKYQQFYYSQARFNAELLDEETYLVVGRRGSGKTSLTQYLQFQDQLRNARYVHVNEPDAYDKSLREMVPLSYYPGDNLTGLLARLWDYIIWSLIFYTYGLESRQGADLSALDATKSQVLNRVGEAIKKTSPALGLIEPTVLPNVTRVIGEALKRVSSENTEETKETIAKKLDNYFSSKKFQETRAQALEYAARSPIVVAIDTVERYDKDDERLMSITAALVQSASNFNMAYSSGGIHVKAFMAAEIFPHIRESAITNTTKYIRHPVYLLWRPKDLVYLICWRLYRYLELHQQLPDTIRKGIDWDDFDDVHEKMWVPLFGEEITNAKGTVEKSFPYVLRHTQMRPRQLVVLCNHIAGSAMQNATFPDFKRENISSLVKEAELELANEVINSYSKIYPRASEIVEALYTSPMTFEGSYLDQVAKITASAWPRGDYTLANFRKLVAELGIVGRVRRFDERTGIIEADFEYALTERLALRSNDQCVIHPMFYGKLHTQLDKPLIVYPFPDHPDYHHLNHN